jgi:hypothetical protein
MEEEHFCCVLQLRGGGLGAESNGGLRANRSSRGFPLELRIHYRSTNRDPSFCGSWKSNLVT